MAEPHPLDITEVIDRIIHYISLTTEPVNQNKAFWSVAGVSTHWRDVASQHQPFWLAMIPNRLTYGMSADVTKEYIRLSMLFAAGKGMRIGVESIQWPEAALNNFPKWVQLNERTLRGLAKDFTISQPDSMITTAKSQPPTDKKRPDVVTMYCQGLTPTKALSGGNFQSLRHLYFYGGESDYRYRSALLTRP